jgi:sporulation protein YlmC with PRC-barrel domain
VAAPYLKEAASSYLEPQVERSQGNQMGTVTDLVVNFGVGVWEGVRIRGLAVSVSGCLQEVCDT